MNFVLQNYPKILVVTSLFSCLTQINFYNPALAQAKTQATISFTGHVPGRCTVIDQFNNLSPEGDIVLEINNIDLVTTISADNSIKIDCNSREIDLDISLKSLESPDSINTIDFDEDSSSIDHTVLVQANGTLINRNGSLGDSTNTLGDIELVRDGNIDSDSQGDIELTLTSNFITKNEGLAPGKYIATFSINATPK